VERIQLGESGITSSETKSEIDRILEQTITDPVSAAFMAPPVVRPIEVDAVAQANAEPAPAK